MTKNNQKLKLANQPKVQLKASKATANSSH